MKITKKHIIFSTIYISLLYSFFVLASAGGNPPSAPVLSLGDLYNCSNSSICPCPTMSWTNSVSYLGNTIEQIDDPEDVGVYAEVIIAPDGLPVIAYRNSTDADLMVTKCLTPSCSARNTVQISHADDIAGGGGISMAIGSDGFPIITYRNNTDTDLMVTKCGNDFCSVSTTTQIGDPADWGYFSSVAIGLDGYPIISHKNSNTYDLLVTRCMNDSCTVYSTTQINDPDSVGYGTSIAIPSDGLPVISHFNNTDYNLVITKCGNAYCTAGNTQFQIANDVGFNYYTSLALGKDGLPIVVYQNAYDQDLIVTKCGNSTCSVSTTTVISNASPIAGFLAVTVGADGLPLISYYNNWFQDLMVTKCGNSSCSSGNTTNQFSDLDDTGVYPCAAIGPDNLPIISHYNDTDGDVMVLKCGNPSCSTYSANVTYNLYRNNPDSTVSVYQNAISPFRDEGGLARSLWFDGVDSYINAGTSPSLQTNESISLEAWIKSSTSTWNAIAQKQTYGANGYWFGTNSTGRLYFYMFSSGILRASSSSAWVTNGSWHHVVATYDGYQAVYYVDGALVGTKVWGSYLPLGNDPTVPLRISGYEAQNAVDGNLDEVRIYARVLSPAEVSEHFAGTYNNENDLRIYLGFNEATGTIAYDGSGYGNNGTLYNGPEWQSDSPVPVKVLPLEESKNYSYYVRAFDALSQSSGSSNLVTVNASCNVFQNKPDLTLTPYCDSGSPKIKLDWSDDPNALYWSIYRIGTTSVVNISSPSEYIDSEVVTGNNYQYRVVAYSSASNTSSDLLAAQAPYCYTGPGTSTLSVGDFCSCSRSGVSVCPVFTWTQSTSSFSNITTQYFNAAHMAFYTSIALGTDGLPIVAYKNQDAGDLMITKCGNPSCSGAATTTQITHSDDVGYLNSIAVSSDGLPIVAYNNITDGDLMITKCGNLSCSSGNTTTQINDSDDIAEGISIAIGSDGLPIISHKNQTDTDLMITKCGNPSCSSGNTTTQISNPDNVGYFSSIAIAPDNLPVIAYKNSTQEDLMITKCGNASCSSGNTTTRLVDPDISGYGSSITIAPDGLPIISHANNTDFNLIITKCGNSSCSTSTNVQVNENIGFTYRTSIATGTDGFPVIAYYHKTLGDLRVLKCNNLNCSSYTTSSISHVDDVGDFMAIKVPSDGLPIISYKNESDTDLMITKCGTPSCQDFNSNLSYNLYRINPDASTSTYSTLLQPFRDQGSASIGTISLNSYIDAGSGSSLNISGEITIEAWVKETTRASYAKIVSRRSGDSFYFLGSTNGSPYGGIGSGTGFTVVTKDTQMPSNEWHHLAFTFVDLTNQGCLYYDGALSKCGTITQSIGNLSGVKLSIGADNQGTANFFKGLMDEVRIYGKALSTTTIANHFAGTYNNENDLRIYLGFNEATGTMAYDGSGYGNNGTLYNGPEWQSDSPVPVKVLPLEESKNYSYYVRAFDSLGQTNGPSNIVQVNHFCGGPLIAPVLSLNGLPFSYAVPLVWTDSGNEESYNLYRRDAGQSFYDTCQLFLISSSSGPNVYHSDNTVLEGTTTEYRVVAIRGSERATSNVLSVDIPVSAPGSFNLTGSFMVGNKVLLSWNEPTHSEAGGLLIYTVYRDSSNPLTSPKTFVCSTTEPALSCFDNSPNLTEKFYQAEARNLGGTEYTNVWTIKPPVPKWRESAAK